MQQASSVKVAACALTRSVPPQRIDRAFRSLKPARNSQPHTQARRGSVPKALLTRVSLLTPAHLMYGFIVNYSYPLLTIRSSLQVAGNSSDPCDFPLTSPAVTAAMEDRRPAEGKCSDECPCCCHRPSRDVQLIPKVLRPWLGQLNVPPTLLAAFSLSFTPCDHADCARGRQQIQKIKYTSPGWFVQVEATIRFEAVPVHFCIQTPRTVPSLQFLSDISFDEFKMKLSTRELTLCDVEPDGFSVLHVSLRQSRRVRTLLSW